MKLVLENGEIDLRKKTARLMVTFIRQ